jgi:hypothetical protein
MIFWSQNFRNGARSRGSEMKRVEWFSVVAGWEVESVRDVLAQTEQPLGLSCQLSAEFSAVVDLCIS